MSGYSGTVDGHRPPPDSPSRPWFRPLRYRDNIRRTSSGERLVAATVGRSASSSSSVRPGTRLANPLRVTAVAAAVVGSTVWSPQGDENAEVGRAGSGCVGAGAWTGTAGDVSAGPRAARSARRAGAWGSRPAIGAKGAGSGSSTGAGAGVAVGAGASAGAGDGWCRRRPLPGGRRGLGPSDRGHRLAGRGHGRADRRLEHGRRFDGRLERGRWRRRAGGESGGPRRGRGRLSGPGRFRGRGGVRLSRPDRLRLGGPRSIGFRLGRPRVAIERGRRGTDRTNVALLLVDQPVQIALERVGSRRRRVVRHRDLDPSRRHRSRVQPLGRHSFRRRRQTGREPRIQRRWAATRCGSAPRGSRSRHRSRSGADAHRP